MRRGASLLRVSNLLIDQQVADELDARALWLERAAGDPGLTVEQRRAIAAIENGQPAAAPVLDVTVYGPFRIRIWRHADAVPFRFYGNLARSGVEIYETTWDPSQETVIDSIAAYLAHEIPAIPPVEIQEALRSLLASP